ncbi:hypothetical protein CIK00_13855 [Photobacterium carnosum]|uniref:Uncharacterized protein n=1 Tax=Photobacterium carnosum TaxID=2023717 RepID=A0A2N4UQB3_9GAMM|nr:hypothetical protein CIK00_13855 [Photobacterium carnosum]
MIIYFLKKKLWVSYVLQLIQYAFMLAGQLTLPSQQKVVRLTAQPFCPCCQHVMQLAGIFRPR